MLKYNKDLIVYAKELRKNMTPWEIKLWTQFLRNYPVRFQRQKVIGNYIVDFYCAKARLVIELDGGGHYTEEQKLYDKNRTDIIEKQGMRVLRISIWILIIIFTEYVNLLTVRLSILSLSHLTVTAPSSEGANNKLKL